MEYTLHATSKRCVFEHPGGLFQIVGALGPDEAPPVTATDFESLGVKIPFASLVRVTARAAYYRAPLVPGSYGSMDPRQR